MAALDAAAEGSGHKRKETVLPTGWGAEFSPEGYKVSGVFWILVFCYI